MNLSNVAESGNRLKTLESLRNTLAIRIEKSESARDVAALSGQLTQVLKQIEELDKSAGAKMSKVDELASRRKQRQKPIKDGAAREG